MKKFAQRLYTVALILALLMLTGCGGVHTDSSSDPLLNSESVSLQYSLEDSSVIPLETSSNTESSAHNTASNGVSSAVTSNVASAHGSSLTGGTSEPGKTSSATTQNDSFMKGVWISYFDMPFDNCNAAKAKEKFGAMMKLVTEQGYNTVFCHVRPAADAFYPSEYFPFTKYISGTQGENPGFDPLKIMISCAKQYGLEFHAWINPYRVATSGTTVEELSKDNIALQWLNDGSGRAVNTEAGIYFNPASTDVQRLVLNGIREILNKYDVDGIHFDDYFYPTTNIKFDSNYYEDYKNKTSNPLSLDDWRRANVNSLVSAAHLICKQKKVLFGISPAGDISTDNSDRNYTMLYADVRLWMRTSGYVDYIIPQIYFGYNHPVERARYDRLLETWCSQPKHSGLKLYIGLAAYKMDEDCDDKEEWHNDSTLMARQATDAKKLGADGIAVFSYKATSSEKEHNKAQISNMFSAINKND